MEQGAPLERRTEAENQPGTSGGDLKHKQGLGAGAFPQRAGSMRLGRGAASGLRLVEKRKGDRSPYALRGTEISPGLMVQLAAFQRFMTTKFYGEGQRVFL